MSKRRNPYFRRNLLVAPVVLLVRLPLLLPLWLLMKIGRGAEAAGEWVGDRLPGFKR